ncbi:MAG: SixA phosphatase family protein [Mangrovibacterium sp.]
MKTIVMIRHAKAESGGYENDFNRKLQPKGELDAAAIGARLQTLRIIPNRIIASPADRAWKTAAIYAEKLAFEESKIEPWEAFYRGATTHNLLEKVYETSDKFGCIYIVGHNPTIHYLTHNMCVEFNKDTPTCATAVIQFDVVSWKDVEARIGKLLLHLVPQVNF